MQRQPSTGYLAKSLDGVWAEKGAIVMCRDAAAFEILLRLNANNYDKRFIVATLNPQDAQERLNSSTEKLLFVKDIANAEDEIQAWLDPFCSIAKGHTLEKKKRIREEIHTSSSDEDDSSWSSS
ncbi:unnamed protein product [Phytomonas sp. EM1]|nr:unnamed protein product [Phytomonas sp. EM1]|eukprot:CCW62676.1 unnamed protein product [Phytomonas sp. isolate EM1]